MIKKYLYTFFLLGGITFALSSCGKKTSGGGELPPPVVPVVPVVKSDVSMWLTTPDKTALLQKQNVSLVFGTTVNQNPTITIDTAQTYQTIDGFGFCLTGGSATLINGLGSAQEDALLRELFLADSAHIGISYLRISIGASDLSAAPFTYDDLASGQTDVNLVNFSIDKEKTDLIPVLKKIIALNPSIKILACPWSAPVWMKTNNSFIGGSLKTAYYDVYARYFVKYIQAMQAQGIMIDAVTPQNEPLNPLNNPSMEMQAAEEGNFIKNNLGPQFKGVGLNTKIIIYDHNADNTNYPLNILADAAAFPYIDGSAFHLYAGDISALTLVHNAYPSKNIYFTEQYTPSTGSFSGDLQWHINNLIIGATRNWSRNVLEWNLASDPNLGPHTNGGCPTCLGALTIGTSVARNVSYYIIAQASKFVRPGAVRIASDIPASLPNVAFKNIDGSKVLIVLNNSTSTQIFNIKFNGKTTASTLSSGAVATYKW